MRIYSFYNGNNNAKFAKEPSFFLTCITVLSSIFIFILHINERTTLWYSEFKMSTIFNRMFVFEFPFLFITFLHLKFQVNQSNQ